MRWVAVALMLLVASSAEARCTNAQLNACQSSLGTCQANLGTCQATVNALTPVVAPSFQLTASVGVRVAVQVSVFTDAGGAWAVAADSSDGLWEWTQLGTGLWEAAFTGSVAGIGRSLFRVSHNGQLYDYPVTVTVQ